MEEWNCSENFNSYSRKSGTPRKPPLGGNPLLFPSLHSNYASHRDFCLGPMASKLLLSVIALKLYNTRKRQTRDEQAGFRAGRGWTDENFTVRLVLVCRFTSQRSVAIVLLDIFTAFNSTDRSALWHCLLRMGISAEYVSGLKWLHRRTSGRVKAYGRLSPPFVVSNGVRQVALYFRIFSNLL